MTQKYKIDPKNPWKDPRGCMSLPAGCKTDICQDIPKHPSCNPAEIRKKYQPLIDEANAKLENLNAQLAAERTPCNSIQSQIATTRTYLADCESLKAACERSKQGGTGKKNYGTTHQRASKKIDLKKGGSQQSKLLLKNLQAERKAIQSKIDAASAELTNGAKCSANLNSLNTELAAIKKALIDCEERKKAACEAPKPIDNGAFNLNTRADLNHVRTGAGRREVYGTYQRGPKKGKLKKGYKFVNGVATKVM